MCLSVVCGEKFDVCRYAKTFQPNSFMHAMLVGTINLCYFILQSGDHMVSAKQRLFGSFLKHFLSGQDEMLDVGAIEIGHPDTTFG